MRDSLHKDLDKISEHLVELTKLAGAAISGATTALLDADLHLAESVIASDEQIDALRRELNEHNEHTVDLLARQQPVATDLRIMVTAMRIDQDLQDVSYLVHEEFDEHLDPQGVDQCLKKVSARFDGARVRAFVPLLVRRYVREDLVDQLKRTSADLPHGRDPHLSQ